MIDGVGRYLVLPWHSSAEKAHADASKPTSGIFEQAHQYHDAVQPVSSVDEGALDTGHEGQDRERSREQRYIDVEAWMAQHNASVQSKLSRVQGQKAIQTYESVAKDIKPKTP